jgi:hypothetical protein
MTHNRNRRVAALGVLALSLASGQSLARDPPLLSLGMEHFRDTASITEGASSVTVSTQPGFVERLGPLRTVWNDQYLQATIDKSAGRKSFEVDTMITYSGRRRSYQKAIYETPSGPHETAATLVRAESANCAIECTYTEHLTFSVDEALLRSIAAGYTPGKPTLWRFKLITTLGLPYRGELSNAEIAGLLAKVDGYSAAPALAAAAPAQRPVVVETPHPMEFGVSGIAVQASPDLPKRSGVLVAGVTQGSPAQKSGVIIGDIIYQLDAHTIKAPSDLQAATAGIAAGSASVLKLFRGTSEVALSVKF